MRLVYIKEEWNYFKKYGQNIYKRMKETNSVTSFNLYHTLKEFKKTID